METRQVKLKTSSVEAIQVSSQFFGLTVARVQITRSERFPRGTIGLRPSDISQMSSERWSTRGERVARVPLRSQTIRVPGARESVRRKCGSHYCCCSSLCSGQVREHSIFPPFSRLLRDIRYLSTFGLGPVSSTFWIVSLDEI